MISYSFLDVGPLSRGHALVIPKCMYHKSARHLFDWFLDHAEKLHELPEEHLTDILPIARKIAVAQGLENYNILQNNETIAHQVMRFLASTLYNIDAKQVVQHVHFHVIPKPTASDSEGLVIKWPTQQISKEELKALQEELQNKL